MLGQQLTQTKSPVIPGNRKYFCSYSRWESKYLGDLSPGTRESACWNTGELSSGLGKQWVENGSHRSSANCSTLFRREQPAGSSALSFLEVSQIPRAKRQQYHNHAVWQLEVSDRRWGESWVLTSYLSMTLGALPFTAFVFSFFSGEKYTKPQWVGSRLQRKPQSEGWLSLSTQTGKAPLPRNSLANGRAVVCGKAFLTGRALGRKGSAEAKTGLFPN